MINSPQKGKIGNKSDSLTGFGKNKHSYYESLRLGDSVNDQKVRNSPNT